MNEGQERSASFAKRSLTFREGDEVLVNYPNDYKYFGVIVDIDSDNETCLVRYGDRTEQWAPFREVKKLGLAIKPEPDPVSPERVNRKVVKKSRRSVNKSQKANVKLQPDTKPLDLLSVPEYVLVAREKLPYRLETLTWDDNHLRNDQESYCYCGEDGFWYNKMYQCNTCLQWFHQSCSEKCLAFDMLNGDRFFNFVCSICSPTGNESIQRLDMTILDALHLAILNITLKNVKKFHHLSNEILPFMQEMKKSILGPHRTLRLENWDTSKVMELLVANREIFLSGTSDRQNCEYWGINFRMPTSPPIIGNLTKPKQASISAFHFRKGPTLKQLSKLGSYDWLIQSNEEWLTMNQTKYDRLKTVDQLIPNPQGFLSPTFNPFEVSAKIMRHQSVGRKPTAKILPSRFIQGIRRTPLGKREYLVQFS